MIIVDGCKSDKEISNFANLEEVLTNLMDDEKMDDRVVTDVFVNNESFSEIYPHQAEDVSCDTITSVEVRSVPAGPGIPHPYDKSTKTRLYPHYHSGCGRGTDCPCPPRLVLSQAFGHISGRC